MWLCHIQVRSSVFGLVCSLADSTHYLSSDYKHFTSLVLGGLSEKDPVVIGPLWDAVLYLIDTHKVTCTGMYDNRTIDIIFDFFLQQ